MMKILTLGYFLFYSIFGFAQKNNYIENDTLITWSKDRKLTWSDFKKNNDSLSTFSAVTSSSIYMIPEVIHEDNIYDISVFAYFFKNESFSKTKSASVLRHEQLHFDISEIFARKIRKCFEELKKNCISA